MSSVLDYWRTVLYSIKIQYHGVQKLTHKLECSCSGGQHTATSSGSAVTWHYNNTHCSTWIVLHYVLCFLDTLMGKKQLTASNFVSWHQIRRNASPRFWHACSSSPGYGVSGSCGIWSQCACAGVSDWLLWDWDTFSWDYGGPQWKRWNETFTLVGFTSYTRFASDTLWFML